MRLKKNILLIMLVLLVGISCTGCAADRTMSNDNDSKYYELVTCVNADVGILNPVTDENNFEMLSIFGLVYEPLIKYNNGEFEPGLAESWEVSADKTEYTFHLRKNISFTDGSSFNAEAVKKNIEGTSKNLDFWGWLGVIKMLDRIEVVDEHTIKLFYNKPYYATLYDLSAPCPIRMIAPSVFPESGNPMDDISAAVGTGPYTLTEVEKNKQYVFERNEDYWGEKPKYNKVIVKVIPDEETRNLALRSGDIDMIFGSNLVSQKSFQQFKQDSNFGTKISDQVTRSRNILMNTGSTILNDLNVRKAIQHVINKQEIIDNVLYGMEEKADYIMPPSVPYCEIVDPPYEYNKERAYQLLEGAGWLPGTDSTIREKDNQQMKLELIYRKGNGSDQDIAQAFQGLMRDAGIEVNITGYEFMTWYSRAMHGQYDFAINDTYGTPYIPHVYVYNMITAGIDKPAQQGLPMKNEFDQKIIELQETGDDQKISEIYNYIMSTLHQNAVNLPISYQNEVVVYNKNKINDIEFSGLPYEIDVSKIK